MIDGSCRERILSRLPRMTGTEEKVANYVLANYEEVLHINVAELAKRAEVSDASIVRFCRSIGYKGFTDFKMNLARDVVPEEKQFDPILEKGDDAKTVCRKIFHSEISVLNRTLLELDVEAMNTLSEKIFSSSRLAIFATGGSLMVAKDAQHKFLKIGIPVIVYEDVDLQMMSASLLTKGDVALCISFSGNNLHVLKCMKMARVREAYCGGILSQRKSPLSKVLQATLYSSYDETIFQSESVSTRIAQLALIDAMVGNVALRDYEKFNRAIGLTRSATSSGKY